MSKTATMYEQGNGFAAAGDYVQADGQLFRVVSIGDGRILTGDARGNRIEGVEVEVADWSDCPEGDEKSVKLVLGDA